MREQPKGRTAGGGHAASAASAAQPVARPASGAGAHELPGLSQACRVLAAGGAAVVPNPAPLAYGVVATTARVLNEVKHRPPDRNVAVSLHHQAPWQQVAPGVDLPPAALDAVVALLELRLSVLLPLRSQWRPPAWVTPAVRNGYLAAFDGRRATTARLWRTFPRLFGSSANVTGQPPAASAGQAAAMLGPGCAVVDAGELEDQQGPRLASTMVRIDPTGRLHLHRSGAQDTTSGLPPNEYLRHLAAAVGLPRPPTWRNGNTGRCGEKQEGGAPNR